MSDRELTEDDHEINVLDTDSRLSNSDSEGARSRCSTPGPPATSTSALPFSISNLLGKHLDEKSPGPDHPGLAYPGLVQPRGFLSAGFYGPGVLRVPAHRPLGGPVSPGAVFSPWHQLGLDPGLQRTAAAAFASQVIKDRLSGKFKLRRKNSLIQLTLSTILLPVKLGGCLCTFATTKVLRSR